MSPKKATPACRRRAPGSGLRARGGATRRGGPLPWYGDGLAPLELWPGVTIDFQVTWVPLTGVRKVQVPDEHAEGQMRDAWVRKDGTEVPRWYGAAGGRWETHGGKYYFDAGAADTAVRFFPLLLTHHIGEFAGQPFELMEYQKKLLTRVIFGWKRAADGLRRFRKVFAFLPKGAGKSPWGSGTAIYLARLDNEAAAEVYAVSGDKNQAKVVHENAQIMVEASDDLKEGCEVTRDAIVWGHQTLRVLSSDASTKHGFRPHGVVFDEFHNQRNRQLYEALKRSMVKRRQPVMIIITHAGEDDEGICYEEYEYAKAVLSGSNPDETCLPVIFEAKPDDDWTNPAVWRRVNPGHGITVKDDGVAGECLEAQQEPRKLNDFLRYQLNRWVNQAAAWIPVDWWDKCNAPLPPDEVLRTAAGAVGIDASQKIDLTAAVAVFRLPLEPAAPELTIDLVSETVTTDDSGEVVDRTYVSRKQTLNYRLAILPAFWLPEATLLERVKKDHVPYDLWLEQGLLRVTEGPVIDTDELVDYLKLQPGQPRRPGTTDLVTRFPLLKQARFGYDPAFATEIALSLQAMGLTTVEVPQNYTHLSEACQVFEALVKAGRVIHGGHRLLRNHIENVLVKRDDAGRIKPVKPRKQTKRIDGVLGTLIALSQLIRTPMPSSRRRRGPRVWTPEGFVPVLGEGGDADTTGPARL